MYDLGVLREGPLAIRKVMVEARWGAGGGGSTKVGEGGEVPREN